MVNVQIRWWNQKVGGVEINNIDCFTAALAAYEDTRLNTNCVKGGIKTVHLITLIQQLHAHMNIYTDSKKEKLAPSSYSHY